MWEKLGSAENHLRGRGCVTSSVTVCDGMFLVPGSWFLGFAGCGVLVRNEFATYLCRQHVLDGLFAECKLFSRATSYDLTIHRFRSKRLRPPFLNSLIQQLGWVGLWVGLQSIYFAKERRNKCNTRSKLFV